MDHGTLLSFAADLRERTQLEAVVVEGLHFNILRLAGVEFFFAKDGEYNGWGSRNKEAWGDLDEPQAS